MRKGTTRYVFLILLLLPITLLEARKCKLPLHLLKVPPGFAVELFACPVPGARSIILASDKKTVFVSSRKEGVIYYFTYGGEDRSKPLTPKIFDKGLKVPNGITFLGNNFYVATQDALYVYPDALGQLSKIKKVKEKLLSLPDKRWHGWRYMVGKGSYLYISIGAPCNVCEKEIPFATIMRFNLDNKDFEPYALGVRNSVGMTFHPETGELWFTDNGRDFLGDDSPPDELNVAYKKGLHFGFPYCHGKDISDPKFGRGDCSKFEPPAAELGPHVASLGLIFYTGNMFPKDYKGKIFIAEHGSWNRSTKIGYRITMLTPKGRKAVDYRPFIEGWLYASDKVWGRPVDLLQLPDGSILITDDYADAVYRLYWKGDH